MSEMEVYPSRRNLFLVVLTAIAIFVISYFLSVDDSPDKLDWVAAYLLIGLSGAVVLVFGWKLLRHRPLLIIRRDGIVDQFSMFKLGLIKWEDIDHIYESIDKRSKSLVIIPDDDYVSAILMEQTAIKRYLLRKEQEMGGFQIKIPQFILSIPIAELILTINQYDPYAENKRTGL